ncbi:MAG: ATP-binding protein [Polyangiaceae bacterium]|nr:ATP-binding protein [Polyangiaceae bacterium]
MTLAGRLILSTTLLTLLTTTLLAVGVRSAWRSAEERRFVEQFQAATRELQTELRAQTDELKEALKARCQAEPSVGSALVGLKAGDLEERRLGLRVQVAALMKLVRADELVMIASNGDVLGAGHAPALVGQRSDEWRKLTLELNNQGALRKGTQPLSIHAACLHRDRENKSLWVGLYAARHLDPLLQTVAARYTLRLSIGKAEATADSLVESATVDGLLGLPLTATQSREPLRLAMSELDGTILLIALGTLAAAFGVAYLLSRGIARPLEELSLQVRGMEASEPKPVVARGSRELVNLATTFNQMLADLAASRKRLAKAERLAAQREIARRVAHEIKNPLSPIRAAIETLRRLRARNDPRFGDYFDEATQTVLEEVKRISTIVTEFTQFARLPEPRFTHLDLGATLTHILLLHRTDDVTVHTDLGANVAVSADRDQMIQVFTNLLKNAQEAARMNPTPEIWVTLKRQDRSAILSVRDNGPGLSPEVEARLFEPYVTSKPDGTGLGLAIAERIVQEHRGDILHVRPEGGGAQFVVKIPLADESPTAREASASTDP